MAVFIDTCIFVAARNKSDINHERAVELLKSALKGEYGAAYTSSLVFNEAVTVALVRTKRAEVAIDLGSFILSSRRIKMLHVDPETFKEAWHRFTKYAAKGLSFTDAASITLMEKNRIEYIMSFDRHFDSIVRRIP